MADWNFFEIENTIIKSISQLYQRNEESLDEDIQILKKWMKTQPHLPEISGKALYGKGQLDGTDSPLGQLDAKNCPRCELAAPSCPRPMRSHLINVKNQLPEDKYIQNFLILNKCSIERTKKTIDMYYTLRSRLPDMFEVSNPKHPIMEKIMESIYFFPFPKLTREMYRLAIFKVKVKEMANKIEPRQASQMMHIVQEVRLKEDVMFGDIIIYDMEGLSLEFLKKLTPVLIFQLYKIYENIYSIPLKGVYIVNAAPYINSILALVKTIMKPKLFQRICVCKDTSILRERIPKEILPKDYGGDERSIEELYELWMRKLAQYQKRFDNLEVLKVDEDLRPEKLENDDILGVYGNFKKLDVD